MLKVKSDKNQILKSTAILDLKYMLHLRIGYQAALMTITHIYRRNRKNS
jgi:hypothetical protein